MTDAPSRALVSRALVLALVLTAALGGIAAWSGGFGARVGGADLYATFLSKYRYSAETFREGRIPLWNPYELCGLPLHGTAQGGVLYPPIVVTNMLLRPLAALQVLYDVHLLALIFLSILYLVRVGIGLTAAAVGASLVAASLFNGLAGAGRDHPSFLFSMAYLPAILLAWNAIVGGRRAAAPIIALCLGLQWLPGYPGFPMATAVLFGIVAVMSGGMRFLRRLAIAGVCVALGTLVGSVLILPLAEAVAESVRAAPGSRGFLYLFRVLGAGNLIDTSLDRYGAAGLFCVLLGLLSPGRYRRAWTAALIWAVFAVHRPFLYLYLVFPFSALRNAYGWHHLGPFFAGCLAATGLQRLCQDQPAGRPWVPPVVGVLLAGLALARGSWLAAGIAAACALGAFEPVRRRGGWAVPALLVLFHAIGLVARLNTGWGWPAPDLEALEPRVRILREVRQALPGAPRVVSGPEMRAGLTLAERLPSPAGHEPAVPPRRIARLARHLGLDSLSLAPGSRWRGGGMRAWSKLAASPGVAAALGIGVVAVPPQRASPLLRAGYAQLARLPDGDLVLYRRSMPRFHLAHAIKRAADEEESFRLVSDAGFDPLTTVILEPGPSWPPVAAPSEPGDEGVQTIVDGPEEIRVRATLSSPGVLVIADTYFPGWEARVDGVGVALLRANYAFRAVALGSGTHDVELAYRPLSFRLGVAGSTIGLLLTFAWWLGERSRRVGDGAELRHLQPHKAADPAGP